MDLREEPKKAVTKEEIETYQNEIANFYHQRKIFMWTAISLFILAFVLIFVIAASTNPTIAYLLTVFDALCILGGIVLFILRGALYNKRIASRKEIIAQYQKDISFSSNESADK